VEINKSEPVLNVDLPLDDVGCVLRQPTRTAAPLSTRGTLTLCLVRLQRERRRERSALGCGRDAPGECPCREGDICCSQRAGV
jgi:hypothetical protein